MPKKNSRVPTMSCFEGAKVDSWWKDGKGCIAAPAEGLPTMPLLASGAMDAMTDIASVV